LADEVAERRFLAWRGAWRMESLRPTICVICGVVVPLFVLAPKAPPVMLAFATVPPAAPLHLPIKETSPTALLA
jgi:hypothetical protein